MPPPRPRIVALVLALVTLLAVPVFAGAQSTRTEQSLAVRTASLLERSPVVVEPPFDRVITPADERRFARQIKASGKPILMALVPLVDGDQFDGESRAFATALRDRLGRDGIFVVVEDRYPRVFEYRQGEERYGGPADNAVELANLASDDGKAYERNLRERLDLFLDYVQLPAAELEKRVAAYRQASEERRKTLPGQPSGQPDEGGVWWTTVLFVLAVVVLLIWSYRFRRRRREGAHPVADALPVLPDRVFEHARAAQRADLRDDADEELLKLSALLDDQPTPKKPAAQDAYQRALDAYAAARRRTGPEARTVDLVGALVLVDHARHDLASAAAIDAGRRAPERPALCVFDPLHGRAARKVLWQHEGERLDVPACEACADAVRRGTAPDALRDGDQPYFEADTVWARTGFGMFSDDLVQRVSRGER